jgi:hypothetical protein
VLRPRGSAVATSGWTGCCASIAPGNIPGFGAANEPATMNATRKIVSVTLILTTASFSPSPQGLVPQNDIYKKNCRQINYFILQHMVLKVHGLDIVFY